jgi:IS30 family transposase
MCDLPVVNIFDLAQRKYEKTEAKKAKQSDLTLEIKSGLKNTSIRVKSKNNSRCLLKKTDCHVSTESIYQHIWKIKRKGEFVFKSTNNWERYRKEEVKKRLQRCE